MQMNIVKTFEYLRYIFVTIGLYMAYASIGNAESFTYLLLLVIVPLSGLTGLESILFSQATAKAKDREQGSAYQIQSGLNNLSIAITAIMVWWQSWGIRANMTIIPKSLGNALV